MDLAALHPALQFFIKGPVTCFGELGNVLLVVIQKTLILAQLEGGFFHLDGIVPFGEIPADLVEFFVADFIEANLVEEAQQPGFVEGPGFSVTVPHLQGAAHELVPPGTFHAVHAQVGAANAHGVFRGPGAGRVVLGGDQTVTRIVGRGHWRTQIHIAQPHDHIAGAEQDLFYLIDAVQAVDAANEFQVGGAPGGILAH